MMHAKPRVYVRSDLHDYGRTEDGAPFVGETYYLVAEYSDGTRYRHDHVFPGVAVVWDRDDAHAYGPHFHDIRAKALRAARRVLNRTRACLRTGGSLNLGGPHWERISSAYGSEAYVRHGDEAAWLAHERNQD
jgi:hypothetical protein